MSFMDKINEEGSFLNFMFGPRETKSGQALGTGLGMLFDGFGALNNYRAGKAQTRLGNRMFDLQEKSFLTNAYGAKHDYNVALADRLAARAAASPNAYSQERLEQEYEQGKLDFSGILGTGGSNNNNNNYSGNPFSNNYPVNQRSV